MLKHIENLFDELFHATQPVPAGIYQYQSPEDVEPHFKWHLRVDEDGAGILVVNASTVLHLNQTAAEYAYHTISGKSQDEIAKTVSERYDDVDLEQALQDYHEFMGKVETLILTEDLDPVTYLEMDRVAPYSQKLSAPYRLDCALTYQVSQDANQSAAPTDRVSREMTTAEWKTVLDKAWQAGIPHIIFTGGEPTLREDLPELIAFTEDAGMVCGLLTDGLKFAEKKYLTEILNKGLDHIMLLADDQNKDFWKALKALLAADIAVTVHATLTQENLKAFPKLLERIAKEGVTSVSLSESDESLSIELDSARQQAANLGMKLVWDLPVPYSTSNPVSMELKDAEKIAPEGAGKAWLYVEPDGDVLPAQGVNKVLGNLFTDPFTKVWKHR
jgi:organic radical activating enzyme